MELTKVYIVLRSELHDSYVEKVFENKEDAEKYAKWWNDKPDNYVRYVKEYNVE